MQFAFQTGKTELAEILQTTRFAAMLRVAAAGIPVDAIIADVVTAQTVTISVKGLNVFKQLHSPECGARILGVIAHLSDQVLFGFATVASSAQTFEQRVVVNYFLCRALVI